MGDGMQDFPEHNEDPEDELFAERVSHPEDFSDPVEEED